MLQDEVDRLEEEINKNSLFDEFMKVKMNEQLFKMKEKAGETKSKSELSKKEMNKYYQLFDKIDVSDFEEFLREKSQKNDIWIKFIN